MPAYFLDTSALVKLYVRERGTDWLLALAQSPETSRFAVLELSRVEFHSAVARRRREGDLTDSVAADLLAQLDSDLGSVLAVVSLDAEILETATLFVAAHPLRAYDAIQVAACATCAARWTSAVHLLASDRRMIEAARNEGVIAVDPEEESP